MEIINNNIGIYKIQSIIKPNRYYIGSSNLANTGRKLNPEHIKKVADANRGRKDTPESREKKRESAIKRWQIKKTKKNEQEEI